MNGIASHVKLIMAGFRSSISNCHVGGTARLPGGPIIEARPALRIPTATAGGKPDILHPCKPAMRDHANAEARKLALDWIAAKMTAATVHPAAWALSSLLALAAFRIAPVQTICVSVGSTGSNCVGPKSGRAVTLLARYQSHAARSPVTAAPRAPMAEAVVRMLAAVIASPVGGARPRAACGAS